MIYAPEAHEQLAGPAWDEGWVRDRIELIAERTECELGADGLWAEHPLDHEDGFQISASAPTTIHAASRLARRRARLCDGRGRRTDDRLEAVVRSNAENPANELLWGSPGTMAAAIAMHRR
jgi:hypothetical protein